MQTTFSGKPACGITQVNNLASWIFDTIDHGIDTDFEQCQRDLIAQFKLENPEMSDDDIDEKVFKEMDCYDNDDRNIIFGDWKKENGQYLPDENGKEGYAAEYSNFCGGTVTVVWSKHTTLCAKTSPCFVMSDNSGPCGDLDTSGNDRLAYTLPAEFFDKDSH